MPLASNQNFYDHIRYYHLLTPTEAADLLDVHLGVYEDAHDALHLVETGHEHDPTDGGMITNILQVDVDGVVKIVTDNIYGRQYVDNNSQLDTLLELESALEFGDKFNFLINADNSYIGLIGTINGAFDIKDEDLTGVVGQAIARKYLSDYDIINLNASDVTMGTSIEVKGSIAPV